MKALLQNLYQSGHWAILIDLAPQIENYDNARTYPDATEEEITDWNAKFNEIAPIFLEVAESLINLACDGERIFDIYADDKARKTACEVYKEIKGYEFN